MASLIKIAAILTVLTALGALQFAVPLFSDNEKEQSVETVSQQSQTKVALSFEYESQSTSQSRPQTNVVPTIEVNDFSDVEEGSLFFENTGENENLFRLSPLVDTQLKLSVTGLIARAKLTQTFTNQTAEWVNGLYVFPLPTGAAVDHLVMQIGERRIEGQIQPKVIARQLYQEAKREGKKASLLEQQKPNLFTSSVANIGPGESIEITIEYQQMVHFDNGQFQLRFPMTITPRYRPDNAIQPIENADVQEAALSATTPLNAAFDERKKNAVSITARIDAGFELDSIQSEFHNIQTEKLSDWIYAVQLEQNEVANKDFVLIWRAKQDDAPIAAHFTQQFNEQTYGVLMIVPPAMDEDVAGYLPKELTFVLDTSGSMAGEPLRQAKSALRYAIQHLSERDRFNIIEFNTNAKALWSFTRQATIENRQSATDFVNGLESDGGTNMLEALNLAFRESAGSGEAGIEQIVFITDGSVGNDTELLSVIRENLQDKRLFTVGIGAAPNGYFMQEAAVAGKGTFTFIGSVSSVDEKMQSLFDKIRYPVLTNLYADFPAGAEVFPRDIPDLYSGEPLILAYKKSEQPDLVYLSGQTDNAAWSTELDASTGIDQAGLNVIWARKKIEQLSRDRLIANDRQVLNQQIEQVALEHHLVSEFTSLVAVDVTPTALAISKDQQVTNNPAKATKRHVGSLPQTATDADYRLRIGLLFIGVALCIHLRQSLAR